MIIYLQFIYKYQQQKYTYILRVLYVAFTWQSHMMIAIYDSDGISLSRRTESQIRFVVTFMRRVLKKSTQLNVFPKVHT